MSFGETIFLFVLALVIFGPKKLPEIARQVGKYLNEFKRASNEFKAQIEQEIAHLETEPKQTILSPSQPPEGAMSRSLISVPPETMESAPDQPLGEAQATLAAHTAETAPEADPQSSETQTVATEAVPADPVTSQESHA